jgi:hypothetical protein
MGDENSKNPDKGGSKTYRDYIISQLDKEGVGVDSQASQEGKVNDHVDDLPKDFAKLDSPMDGTKSNPEIEHMPQKHSFSHSFDSETLDQGTKVRGMPKGVAKTDDTAKGKQTEKSY